MTLPEKYEHEKDQLPLVTFALFAYNQEQFILQAVEGALSQTYTPLQIILSDDCSTDRTFDLMEGLLATYKGPHSILLNRNESNLGLGRHVNRVVSLAKGDLLVAAAGDDVSADNRVTTLAALWLNRERPSAIYSDCYVIDTNDRIIADSFPWSHPKYSRGRALVAFG